MIVYTIQKRGDNVDNITDFYEDHFHDIEVCVSRAIPVSQNRHVHFVYAKTKVSDGHCHKFMVATLIENPIGD